MTPTELDKIPVPRVLTIAGSDSGGGAGIQADLKTFTAFGTYGMSVITAVTAQNTRGVQAIAPIDIEIIDAQIDSVMQDIGADAIKTGMLADTRIVELVARKARQYAFKNLVVDPVMIAKGGDALLSEDARETIKKFLLPLAKVITPNVHEAGVLTGLTIKTIEEMQKAAMQLKKTGCENVVIKGGHSTEVQAVDVFYDGSGFHQIESDRYSTANTHGTGCTFASAIAAALARGLTPLAAVKLAKKFISEAIGHPIDIGTKHGPVNHLVKMPSVWR